jgi:hypothetical protein
MSRIEQRHASFCDDGSVMRRIEELVDTLAWIRIELAPVPDASTFQSDAARRQRALAQIDNALDLAKHLVLELDGELRLRRDDGSQPAAAE